MLSGSALTADMPTPNSSRQRMKCHMIGVGDRLLCCCFVSCSSYCYCSCVFVVDSFFVYASFFYFFFLLSALGASFLFWISMCTSEFRLDFVGGWGVVEIVEGGIDDKSVWGFVFLFSVFGFRSRFSVCRSKHRGGRRYTAQAFVYPNLLEYLAKNFVSSEIFVCASFRLLVSSATSTHRQTHTGTESGRESE